jgi:hypothetical protein
VIKFVSYLPQVGGFLRVLKTKLKLIRVRVMVLNTTFNNISVISRRSVLLEKETGVPGENHQPVASN